MKKTHLAVMAFASLGVLTTSWELLTSEVRSGEFTANLIWSLGISLLTWLLWLNFQAFAEYTKQQSLGRIPSVLLKLFLPVTGLLLLQIAANDANYVGAYLGSLIASGIAVAFESAARDSPRP